MCAAGDQHAAKPFELWQLPERGDRAAALTAALTAGEFPITIPFLRFPVEARETVFPALRAYRFFTMQQFFISATTVSLPPEYMRFSFS